MKRVLVVRAGSAPEAVRAAHGDFDAWFAALLAGRARAEVADGRGALPAPARLGGVLVTGSLASVTRPEPWMDALGAWLLGAAGQGVAVLGVCFGHQLLARALGGRVERHPAGPEAGTAEVELTEAGRADPLLAGLPSPLPAQMFHEDHVPEPPPGAVVLARNAHGPVQAFAHGPRLRAVQFHPELDAERCRALAAASQAWLEAGRPGLGAAALAGIRPTPHAAQVVGRWVDAFVA